MITRILVATLVGGVFLFLIGYPIYGILLDGFFKANMTQIPGLLKPTPNFVLLGIAHLAFAGLLSIVSEYWARIRTFSAGLKVGALITLPLIIWTDTIYEAGMEIYRGVLPIIVDVVVATILGTLTGGVIGFVLGKMDKVTEDA